MGVLGADGEGLAPATAADVIVGTLGKSVGSSGAFVAGPAGLADLLWNRARPLVFSTGPTVGSQAAALAGVEIARSEEGAAMRAHLEEFKAFKAARSAAAVGRALDELARAANDPKLNVFGAVVGAAESGCTHGEICATLRRELGFGHVQAVV